jgi:hypothetical protein
MLDHMLERVDSVEDGDQELLALLETSRPLRVEAYTRALRVGPEGTGAAGELLWGELSRLGGSEDDAQELAEAIGAAGSLRFAGVCAEVTVDALRLLPDGGDRVAAFAEAARPGDELQALLTLTLLASEFGDAVRTLAPQAVATLLAATEAPEEGEGFEPVDPMMIRGALDALVLPYEDLSGSSWSVRLPYRDEFEQRQRLSSELGLTGRSLVLRASCPEADSERLLRYNHASGLARFGRGLGGGVTIVAEIDRRAFSFEVFERLIEDFTAAVEHVAGPGSARYVGP